MDFPMDFLVVFESVSSKYIKTLKRREPGVKCGQK
jgi:hypothetical protein